MTEFLAACLPLDPHRSRSGFLLAQDTGNKGEEWILYVVTATKAEVHSAMACNYRRSRSYVGRAWWSQQVLGVKARRGKAPFRGGGQAGHAGSAPYFA